VTVYLVGAGPGDPGLLTRRGAELLARADVVLFDRLVPAALLDLAPPTAELIDVGKDPDPGSGGARRQEERQEEIGRLLVERGRAHGVVVRLKGGDPFVFGRGGEEVEVLSRAGIAWEVVPGVTSAFGVPAAAGVPVTQRGLASSVTVVTGRVGDPAAAGGVDWGALAKVGGTLVILMGMTTRAAIAEKLMRGGRARDTPVAVIERGTTSTQRMARTTLAGLADVDLGSPAIIVVGPVAALGAEQLVPSSSRPLSGRTVVATRSGPRSVDLIDALERVGASVVALPLTRQVDPADGGAELRLVAGEVSEVGRMGRYAWVVFTSVNAVERFMAELRDARALADVAVAAVGPATTAALRRAGVEPDLVPADNSARGVVEAFHRADLDEPRRVLFPSADIAPATIPEGLRGKGWEVRPVEAYRTVLLTAPEPGLLARVAEADAIVFTASSSVEAFLALRTPDGAAVPTPPHVVCIGPTTAASARAAGIGGVHEAFGASAEGIVAELVDHFGGRGRGAS
jgi:uroporphyrinogen III methyltransferase/synthase